MKQDPMDILKAGIADGSLLKDPDTERRNRKIQEFIRKAIPKKLYVSEVGAETEEDGKA